MTLAELTHEEKVTIFVLGNVGRLVGAGLVVSPFALSPAGAALYLELRTAGFRPSTNDLSVCVPTLATKTPLGTAVTRVILETPSEKPT